MDVVLNYVSEFYNALSDQEDVSILGGIASIFTPGGSPGGILPTAGTSLIPAAPDFKAEAFAILRDWLSSRSHIYQPTFRVTLHNLSEQFTADWPPPYWKMLETLQHFALPQSNGPRKWVCGHYLRLKG